MEIEQKLEILKELNLSRMRALEEENDFIKMNQAIECSFCNGTGQILFVFVQRGTITIRLVSIEVENPQSIMEDCDNCDGEGNVCKSCQGGSNSCDCGDFIEKNIKENNRAQNLIFLLSETCRAIRLVF